MQYIVYIIFLVLLQGLLFSHMHIFGIATPLLHTYLVLCMSRDMAHWKRMVIAFVVGLVLDMFDNTPGLNAASLVAMAFVQPYVLEMFLRREDSISFVASMDAMGFQRYLTYILMLCGLFCVVYSSLEAFTLHSMGRWFGCVVGSLFVTTCLILAIDNVKKNRR